MTSRFEILTKLAGLIGQRNEVETEVTAIIERPMLPGHVGEFIAAMIFDIRLEEDAARAAVDGVFVDGPLMGRTVNVKWYAKRVGLLNITLAKQPDIYLVLTGPASAPIGSRYRTRPWRIDAVYCFDGPKLVAELVETGKKLGIATGVRRALWEAAEIYPTQTSDLLLLNDEQRRLLALFALD